MADPKRLTRPAGQLGFFDVIAVEEPEPEPFSAFLEWDAANPVAGTAVA